MTLPNDRHHTWIPPAVVSLLVTLFLFGSVLVSERSFALRDAAHYYPPLLYEVSGQWKVQWPLWNSLEERGRPLWADPTAAVLYPGQLVFALPIPFTTAYEIYIVAHVLIGCLTSYIAARRLRLGVTAATLACVSYTFGGSIVFQYCNPCYLISAAWLPWGLSSAWAIVTGSTTRWSVVELAGVLTLMVLGGDPQSAYLLGLAAVGGAICAAVPGSEKGESGAVRQPFLTTMAKLFLAGTLAVGLSAAQWLPSWAWAKESGRFSTEQVRNDNDKRSDEPDAGVAATVDPPGTDHAQSRYRFSIGPWRWLELFWPNLSGRPFPQNERWIRAIPAEGRFWAPSLYMGILPLLLSVQSFGLRRGRPVERWLSWLVLFGILGSLGRFGVSWLIAESSGVAARSLEGSDATGGVYWIATRILPGFALFRYPAKLWTWTSLGLSLLAGICLQRRLDQGKSPIPRQWLVAYVGTSLLLLLFVVVAADHVESWMSRAPSDPLFGPIMTSAARKHLCMSLAHGAFLGLTFLAINSIQSDPRQRWTPDNRARSRPIEQHIGHWIVLLTTVDLALANAWIIPTASAQALHENVATRLEGFDGRPARHAPLILRLGPPAWYPDAWQRRGDEHRLEAAMIWDRHTARPKYPSLVGVRSLRSTTSFSSRDHLALIELLREVRHESPARWAQLLRQLGVDYVVGPSTLQIDSLIPMDRHLEDAAANHSQVWRVRAPFPRVWIVHEAVTLPPTSTSSTRSILRQTRAVLLPEGEPRMLQSQLVLESTNVASRVGARVSRGTTGQHIGESCEIELDHGSRIDVRARLGTDGWLILNDAYDPGWKATVRRGDRTVPLEVLRANRVMRAIALPAGEHQISFVYRPESIDWGIRITALSLAVLLIHAACTRYRRRLNHRRGLGPESTNPKSDNS